MLTGTLPLQATAADVVEAYSKYQEQKLLNVVRGVQEWPAGNILLPTVCGRSNTAGKETLHVAWKQAVCMCMQQMPPRCFADPATHM